MVTATWNGTVIAKSDKTVMVEGNHYFPAESVDESFLRPSDYTTHCGWKGTASYKSLEVDGQLNENAAWYYPEPKSQASQINDHFAFWKGVEVKGESGPDTTADGAQCSI
ncbi:MAG: DUF427 domain-containing protein [Planctomycetota bacterium]